MKVIKWSNGDVYFDNNGKGSYVENQGKLAQDIAFYVLEALTDLPHTNAEAEAKIMGAISKIKQIQSTKDVPSAEKLYEVVEFFIFSDKTDPTTSYFYLSVSSEAQVLITKLFDVTNKTDLSHLLPEGKVT